MNYMLRVFSSRNTLLGAVALGALTILGVGAGRASPQPNVVVMADMNYGKLPTGLKVGDTITWVNHDSVSHTVTARDRSFDVRVNPGKTASLTLQKAGSIPFYCLYHTAMRGTLNVSAK